MTTKDQVNPMKSIMNIIKSLAVAAALGLMLVPGAALAVQTGALQGYVVDESGLPVPGVRVILSSPQMIGGEKIVQTDAEGGFRYSELEPGAYTVVLSHESYRGFKEENIAVGVGAN